MPTSPRVLIVDADATSRRQLAIWLQRAGYPCVQSSSAMEGMHRLQRESDFRVILLDLDLPDISGHALLDVLQQRHADTPVIAMGLDSTTDDVIRVFRRKVADFLPKPVDEAALEMALRRAGVGGQAAGPERLERPAPRSAPRSPEWGRTLRPAVRRLRGELSRGEASFPVLDPEVATLEGYRDGRAGVDVVVERVARDPGLAGNVIRMANSAFYKRGGEATTLREACIRLGTAQAIEFALEPLAKTDLASVSAPSRGVLDAIWRNTVATSRLADRLARQAGYRDPAEASLAALFHNAGETLLVRLIDPLPKPDGLTLEDVARDVEKMHEDLGRALAVAWGLPQLFVVLSGYHHKPHSSPEPAEERTLRMITLAAWKLALAAGYTYLPGQEGADASAELEALPTLPENAADDLLEEAASWDLGR